VTRKLDKDARIILAGLALFALFFRLATLMMIHTGVDERDYWNSAKAIANALPYPELNHRTNRFMVILPVAGAQLILGSGPNVYYVLPVINSVLQAALAFIVGFKIRGKLAGFLAALCICMFPYMIRAGSQVRPEIFSITYMLLVLLCFVEYLSSEDREISPLIGTALFMFIAYEAKITNLFFLPGLLIAILVYKRKIGHAFLLGGVLLGLYLIETAAYAVITEYKLGMLQVILSKHFSADEPFTLGNFSELFLRYSTKKLQAYWQLPFLLFLIGGIAYLFRGKDKRISSLIIIGLSFFVGITFEVKSLHPITPAEPFINRYFSAVLAPVFLVLAFLADVAISRAFKKRGAWVWLDSKKIYISVLVLGAIALIGVSVFPGLPSGLRKYLNDPRHLYSHPLALSEKYRREINVAYAGGTPIVAVTGLAGTNALSACSSFFIDVHWYREGKGPSIRGFEKSGASFLFLGGSGTDLSQSRYLAAVRTPFRVAPLAEQDLARLGPESFEGGTAEKAPEEDLE
jgi:hypothetical protein